MTPTLVASMAHPFDGQHSSAGVKAGADGIFDVYINGCIGTFPGALLWSLYVVVCFRDSKATGSTLEWVKVCSEPPSTHTAAY